jgi:uncharacterized Zn finger protein
MTTCPTCGDELPEGAVCPFCAPKEDVISELIKAIRKTIGRQSQN